MFVIGDSSNNFRTGYDPMKEVYVNDFDDDYHLDDTVSTSKELQKLKRVYKNIPDYLAARAVYEEYMENLIADCGGEKLFEVVKASGDIDDKLIVEPMFKPNFRDRYLHKLLEDGIIVSKHKSLTQAGDEVIEDYLKRAYPEYDVVDGDIVADTECIFEDSDEDDDRRKVLDTVLNTETFISNNDIQGMQARDLSAYIDAFYDMKSRRHDSNTESTVTSIESDVPSITDVMNNTAKAKAFYGEPELKEEMIVVHGRPVRTSNKTQIQLLEHMKEAGWDVASLEDKFDDNVMRLFKRQLDNYSSLDSIRKKRDSNPVVSGFEERLFKNDNVGEFSSFVKDYEESQGIF